MPSQTSERALVHVVDDDASMRGALAGLFDSVGLDTQTYAAAREFLATNLVDKPGCIVIDIRLPDMNGLAFSVGRRAQGVAGHFDEPRDVRAFLAHLLDDKAVSGK